MRRLGWGTCVVAFAAGLPLAVSVAAYREGPLPAMTGGFGEPSCRSCHFDKPLNDAGGSLAVTGVPERYEAGHVYDVTVTLKRRGLRVAGFEMTARVAAGSHAGQQAGAWRGPEARTRIVFAPGQPIQYLQHTKAGSNATDEIGEWSVKWTAPGGGADSVAFHLAANAANNDDSPLGDFIYTKVLTSRAR